MYDTILVPTDGSEGTVEAIEHALAMARTHGASVHALSVIDERKYERLSDERREEVRELLRKRAERAVDEVQTRGEELDVTVDTAIREGTPSTAIFEYAAAAGVDAIVMGTHGEAAQDRRVKLGSVTQRVVEKTDLPVLVIPIE